MEVSFMLKKLLTLGIALAMLFSVFALTGCEKEEDKTVGTFYSLQEAYDNEWITIEDLRSIAYYYSFTVVDGGSNNPENFEPKPKTPEALSDKTEKAIKRTYLIELQKSISEATIDDVRIADYYGTYGDCVVVNVWDDCIDYDLLFIPEQFIGGVLFRNYCARTASVWIAEQK